jgi:putative ABC transport system substrate-binding protein
MPDIILASSTTNLTVIQEATGTVPVVFVLVGDPVAQGLVASMTKPGGNITGFANGEFSRGGKWLGMLKEIAPGLARVAVMFNPETSPQSKFFVAAIEVAASSLGVQIVNVPVRATTDIEPALESFTREPNGGLMLPTDTFIALRQKLIADLALQRRLPSISARGGYAKQGGLMNYVSIDDQFRQAATYVDRIFKGAKPGEMPVQTPTKFEFLINLKTATALGLTIPPSLFALADEVIY